MIEFHARHVCPGKNCYGGITRKAAKVKPRQQMRESQLASLRTRACLSIARYAELTGPGQK